MEKHRLSNSIWIQNVNKRQVKYGMCFMADLTVYFPSQYYMSFSGLDPKKLLLGLQYWVYASFTYILAYDWQRFFYICTIYVCKVQWETNGPAGAEFKKRNLTPNSQWKSGTLPLPQRPIGKRLCSKTLVFLIPLPFIMANGTLYYEHHNPSIFI